MPNIYLVDRARHIAPFRRGSAVVALRPENKAVHRRFDLKKIVFGLEPITLVVLKSAHYILNSFKRLFQPFLGS